MVITPKSLNAQSEIKVSVNITNTRNPFGNEVVQLYVNYKNAIVLTYYFLFGGFERVCLKLGETKIALFILTTIVLKLLNKNIKGKVEALIFEKKVDLFGRY